MYVQIVRHAPTEDPLGFGNDTSNNGVTSLARCPKQRAILLDEDEPALSTVPEGHVVLRLKRRTGWMGNIAVPVELPPEGRYAGPMFGGCFVYSSDSRFAKLTGTHNPLPVHDRFETWDHYRMNAD